MPSYSPEAIELARRPVFNTNAASIFAGGVVTPTGLKAIDVTTKITLHNQTPPQPPATGIATAVAITAAGAGLTDGTPKAVGTTATKGNGTGLTVDLTIAGGAVTVAAVAAGGTGYTTGDTVTVTGYTGVTLTVTV